MPLMEVFGFFLQVSSVSLFNKPKTPALWTTLTFRVLNISMAVTVWADHHAIFLGVDSLIVHFSPLDKLSASWVVYFQLHLLNLLTHFSLSQDMCIQNPNVN